MSLDGEYAGNQSDPTSRLTLTVADAFGSPCTGVVMWRSRVNGRRTLWYKCTAQEVGSANRPLFPFGRGLSVPAEVMGREREIDLRHACV